MTNRKLSAFIDAIATGRRPKRFRADAEDVEVVRTAIELRAARPDEEAAPSPAFTERLFGQLSDQAQTRSPTGPAPKAAPERGPRRAPARTLLLAAAAVALVGGTAAVTASLSGSAPSHTTAALPSAGALRTGTFLTADGHVLGQIVAYRGQAPWVYLTVADPGYNGPVICTLQVADGSTVAFGTFTVDGGVGRLAKTIGAVDVDRLRGAKLVTSTGTPLAAATFAA
jgi:hypothetical protein